MALIDIDLNQNKASKFSNYEKDSFVKGLSTFRPLVDNENNPAPISAYFELIKEYPELIGNGVAPEFYKLAEEVCAFKESGASDYEINERYKISVTRN